jgi:hypothetical protein
LINVVVEESKREELESFVTDLAGFKDQAKDKDKEFHKGRSRKSFKGKWLKSEVLQENER